MDQEGLADEEVSGSNRGEQGGEGGGATWYFLKPLEELGSLLVIYLFIALSTGKFFFGFSCTFKTSCLVCGWVKRMC